MLDQAAEVRALKDVLEAMMVQNSVLTTGLKYPNDADTLFTVQGAKDFTKRTGVKTRLCAGGKPKGGDTNECVTEPKGDSVPDRINEMMADNQAQIDNLIKILQQQQHLQREIQQQCQQKQEQLQALQRLAPLLPLPQQLMQPHLWDPQYQTGQAIFGSHASLYNPNVDSNRSERLFQYGALTEEQRRKIAMEYNNEQSEREATSLKEQEKMLESIRSSIRDAILEHQQSLISQESSHNQSNIDTLHSLARDTPYKRARKAAKDDQDDISKVMNELRELSKHISRSSGGKGSCGEIGESDNMETDPVKQPDHNTHISHHAQCSAEQSNQPLVCKQQAGYSVPSGVSTKASTCIGDFISAVVKKKDA